MERSRAQIRPPVRVSGTRLWIPLWILGLALALGPWIGGLEARAQSPSPNELAELEDAATQAYIEDDLDTAAALYRQLSELHTNLEERTRILMTVASIEHDQGEIDRAVSTMAEVLTLDPDYQLRPELYGETFVPLFREAKEKADAARRSQATDRVSQALLYLESGDEAGARRLLTEAIDLRGDHPEALYNLGLLDLRQGRDDQAMAAFQKVVALADAQPGRVEDDTLSRALTNAGLLFLQRGNDSDAADLLQRAVELDESNVAAWSNLGNALRALGRRSDAARAFSRAYDRNPDDPTLVSNLAVSYLDAGDAESAIRLLREATDRFPRRADLWLHLGTAYRKLDRNQDSVEALEAALRNDPGNEARVAERAALELAVAQYRLRNLLATLRSADRALEYRPDSVDAMIYRALALEALGELRAAKDTLETARDLAPTRGLIFLNLGSVLYRLDDWDGAEAAYVRALELDPDSTTARQNLDQLRDARRRGAVPGGGSAASVPPSRRNPAAAPSSRPTTPSTSTGPPGKTEPERRIDVGIVFSDVDYSSLGLQGAMIERIRPNTPASRAGLRDGDLLLRFDGETVSGEDDFARRLGRKSPGSRVELALLRDNRPVTVELTVP